MFNIGDLLGKAWNILWRYRVLWVFALLLAVSGGASAGGGGGGGGGGSGTANLPAAGGNWFDREWGSEFAGGQLPQWAKELETWLDTNLLPMFSTEERAIRSAVAIVAVIIGISLLIGLLLALVRYPSETAVMRLVDDHVQTGNRVTFREGWRLGWDQRAWRLFLVDLLIGTPAFTFVILLAGLMVWLVLVMVRSGAAELSGGSVAGMVIIAFIFVLFGIFMWFVSLFRQYVARFATLEGSGVWESFRRGWQIFKAGFSRTLVLGLVLIGVGIAFGLGMMIAALLLIPAYAVMAVPGVLVAAIPGGLAYWIASLSTPVAVAIVIALIVAIPLFAVIVFLPLSFLGGMFAVYTSNIWTLAFRALQPANAYPPAVPFEGPPPLAQ